MKKILVVLLILAVAGGVFAQGNWSLNGLVELGATLDFNTNTYDTPEINGVEGVGFNARDFAKWNDDGGVNRAQLGLSYNRGDGLSIGLNFKSFENIGGEMSFSGENYSLGASGKLTDLFQNGGIPLMDVGAFGQYSMLNGIVDLMVAVSKWIPDPWVSDMSFGIFRGGSYVDGTWTNRWGEFDFQGDNNPPGSYPVGQQSHAWANFCCRSGLMANFNFSGITFGAMLRSGSKWGTYTDPDGGTHSGNGGQLMFWQGDTATPNKAGATNFGNNELNLITQVLAKIIIGMKFDFQPITVAAQFNVEKYGAYIGLNWAFTDAVSAGLSFAGIFKEDSGNDIEDTRAAFGASINYDAGVFGASVKGGYYFDAEVQANSDNNNGGIVGIAPSVWFNVIPSSLRINLDTDFMFGEWGFGWRFVPGILYNFKGTGAGNWDTGIGIHYVLYKPLGAEEDAQNYNEANITFRWNF